MEIEIDFCRRPCGGKSVAKLNQGIISVVVWARDPFGARTFNANLPAAFGQFQKFHDLHLEVSIAMGVPPNGWFILETSINMDDLRVPPL